MTLESEVIDLLNARDFDWAIRAYHPSEQAGTYFIEKLDALRSCMNRRGLGEDCPTIELLGQLVQANPFKLDAFLEALVSLRTAEMLAAAWRVIQGMQIESLQMRFRHAESFSLALTLRSPYGETENYSTSDIDDMTFVRHLMKSKSDNRPIINGFFALRRPKSANT